MARKGWAGTSWYCAGGSAQNNGSKLESTAQTTKLCFEACRERKRNAPTSLLADERKDKHTFINTFHLLEGIQSKRVSKILVGQKRQLLGAPWALYTFLLVFSGQNRKKHRLV